MDKPRDFCRRRLPPVVHRVGWASNPAALRPWSTIGADDMLGRFDDPDRQYRTFYASATPEAALREKILQMIRPDKVLLARIESLTNLTDDDKAIISSLRVVPKSLLNAFVLTTLEVVEQSEVVDVTASSSFDAYYDHTDRRLSVDDILDSECTLASRKFGAKVWQQGFGGVAYPSRHGTDLTNYALFETGHRTDQLAISLRQVDIQPLNETCEPLKTVARALDLALEFPTTYDTRALWVQSFRDQLSLVGEVTWYERAGERGIRYYSMRFRGIKIAVVTFASTNSIEVDAVTPAGGSHVTATTSSKPEEVFAELAEQDESVRIAVAPLIRK